MITLTEEDLEEIKERSRCIGAINVSLDNIMLLTEKLNDSFDKSIANLDEIEKRLDESSLDHN